MDQRALVTGPQGLKELDTTDLAHLLTPTACTKHRMTQKSIFERRTLVSPVSTLRFIELDGTTLNLLPEYQMLSLFRVLLAVGITLTNTGFNRVHYYDLLQHKADVKKLLKDVHLVLFVSIWFSWARAPHPSVHLTDYFILSISQRVFEMDFPLAIQVMPQLKSKNQGG